MAEMVKQPCSSIVELNPEIRVKTSLPPSCHSALRAGFAGYSTNPRWNGAKLKAWRLGKQWRVALAAGEMHICGPDLLLMSPEECEQFKAQVDKELISAPDAARTELGVWRSFLGWSRKKLAAG